MRDLIRNTWAAYSINNDIRMKSSSGGLFFELAKYILDSKGVIYGVAMSDDNRLAEYKRVSDINELDLLLGSKYLQAYLRDTFNDVKTDLDEGKYVLFSGTGCVINGLKAYLRKEYENLISVDIICHGVPSPKIWKDYIDSIDQKEMTYTKSVNFRCKKRGWAKFGILRENSKSKTYYSQATDDPYMLLFLNNIILRPSCYVCKAKLNRLSDISLGDFWGIDNIYPEMNDSKGISLVIIRTKRGGELFDCIKQFLVCKEVDYSEAIKCNPAEITSVRKPDLRDRFFCDAKTHTFSELSRRYVHLSFKQRIKKIVLNSPLERFI